MSNRGFTEAVPLSLSSMAHMTMSLEEGVLDGLKQVLQHTLLSCVNYARAIHPPHKWNFRDLTTSKYAWESTKGNINSGSSNNNHHNNDGPPRDLPTSLQKQGFKHQYPRNAYIYLKPALIPNQSREEELAYVQDWKDQEGILGRISLLYATQENMTLGELDGTESTDEDTPPCVLYKVVVEYRSLPATGNKSAVQAEELSMLSFGGSVDDDVKYGALASLYDDHAKYVLEIYSVRGKKYKFDLMDSTLSDGTVPRLPSKGRGNSSNGAGGNGNTMMSSSSSSSSDDNNNAEPKSSDPFVKGLCVTVTDHATSPSLHEEQPYAITRIHLTMEGNLRASTNISTISKEALNTLPSFHYIAAKVQDCFLSLNHAPPSMARGTPSGHTLLLDPSQAGKVYINGRYVTSWGKDPRIGSHCPALFGMDLHSIPFWHGRIFDYNVLKRNYAQLWQEILIDARLIHLNIGNKLLSRLMTGHDPLEDDDDDENNNGGNSEQDEPPIEIVADTGMECLESQVIQSLTYDPIGISAKALATRFKMEYGQKGFPCLAHEIDWVKDRLPGRVPVAVPQRAINVLRRGGYVDAKRASDDVWFAVSRKSKDGSVVEQILVKEAIQLLVKAGCHDVLPEHIVFFSGQGISSPVRLKGLVRFNRAMRQYHVNEQFVHLDLEQIQAGDKSMTSKEDIPAPKARAFLLGFHIAQEHPDGNVLIRYLLRNLKSAKAL
jgi:hypothetical protein